MILFDQHVHTHFSGDSEELPASYVSKGLELGLHGITITDHIDYDYTEEQSDLFEFDVDKAFAEYDELRERHKGSFEIGRGVETGLRAEPEVAESMRERLNALVSGHRFDAVIGSAHTIDNKDFFYRKYWEDREPKDIVKRYFEVAVFCLRYYDCFDIFGHFDYIVRYAPCDKSFYDPKDYSDLADEALRIIVEKGKALEINTKSLKPQYGLNAPNPCEYFIKRYLELGGELITFGSDAHSAGGLAVGFDTVRDMLCACGARYYAVYRERRPVMLKL